MMKTSYQFYQRGLTIINFLRILEHITSKLEKIGQFFQVNPSPSMPSIATGDKKQFQYLQIVFNNKTRSLVLEFN